MATRASTIEDRRIESIDLERRRAEQEELGKKFEPVAEKFFAYAGQGLFREVRRGTETEDHEMIDFVITLKNGKQVAVQFTVARDVDIRLEKIRRVTERPIVGRLFDKSGRSVPAEPMPRVVVFGGDPKIWEEALEHFSRGDGPHTFFPKPKAQTRFLLDQFLKNLKHLADQHPSQRAFFSEYISYFNEWGAE